jgi:hypothetical protein
MCPGAQRLQEAHGLKPGGIIAASAFADAWLLLPSGQSGVAMMMLGLVAHIRLNDIDGVW